MPEPTVTQARYTAPGVGDLILQFPFGLIMPPTIDLHRPSVGPITFTYQESRAS